MTVDEYIAAAPDARREALTTLRQLCRDEMPGYTETMRYNMPSYEKDGTVEVAFANQKRYISLYVLKEPVFAAYRGLFPKSRVGKGCLRYPNPEKIDFALVTQIIRDAYASDAEIC